MGGCRCSYPNCTVRSDGVTHMFHYPVFDRVRCHQWLVNTNRLEFLNLRVSQLKNRVICQHHFKDSYFMNFKKEKLKFDAVPTESGPFCEAPVESTATEEAPKVYEISLDDIENELIYCEDKKANFSVKYGNFLTNCDLISELDTLDRFDKSNVKEEKTKEPSKVLVDIDDKNLCVDNVVSCYDNLESSAIKPVITEPMFFDAVNPNVLSIEFENLNSLEQKQQIKTPNIEVNNKTNNYTSNIKNEKKIRIISEKKLSLPMPIIGKLEPVSPSLILRVPNKKNKVIPKTNDEVPQFTRYLHNDFNDLVVKDENKSFYTKQKPREITEISEKLPEVSNFSEEKCLKTSNNNRSYTGSYTNILANKACEKQTENKVSLLSQNITKKSITQSNDVKGKNIMRVDKPISYTTNKIPPDRVAAIDKKRKFNMKLRDIIESCLDKIEVEEKVGDKTKAVEKTEEKIKNKTQNVSLSKSIELSNSNVPEHTIASLEARIKTMEDNLLNRIDQNSQKIMDLKNSFTPVTKNVFASTQTVTDENSRKRHLYQEISKYLSSEANSLIYEELFINKIVQKVPKISSPTKRRRCR